MIRQAILFDNGMTMVFDEKGEQVAYLQGRVDGYAADDSGRIIRDAILEDAAQTTVFKVGNFRSGVWDVNSSEWESWRGYRYPDDWIPPETDDCKDQAKRPTLEERF